MNDSKRKRENAERASISIFIPEQKPTMKKWKSGGRCRNADDVDGRLERQRRRAQQEQAIPAPRDSLTIWNSKWSKTCCPRWRKEEKENDKNEERKEIESQYKIARKVGDSERYHYKNKLEKAARERERERERDM